MEDDPRYQTVRDLWNSVTIPTLTADWAYKCQVRLLREFCKKADRSPQGQERRRPAPWKCRRVWIDKKGGYDIYRGFVRLAHDVGHRAYRCRYPHARPHGPGHENVERDIVKYIIATGMLEGKMPS